MKKMGCALASLAIALAWCSAAVASPLATGVSFARVDFTYPGASEPDSPYGQIFLDYAQIPGSGYVNVVTSVGWVVQNMPVFGGSGLPGLSMMFDLGFSGPQTLPFDAVVDYSPIPLPDDSTITGPPQDFGFLPHVEHNAEGGGDPLTGPPGNPAGMMTTTFDPNGVTSAPVINTTSPSVEQDTNQCGPGAVANSLAYLNARYGVPLAHTHKPGINGAPADSLVGQIDVQVPRAQGQGVWRADLLDGKLRYLDLFGPHSLSIKHQGIFDDAASNLIGADRTQGRETSKFKGNLVTVEFLMDEVHHGEDVEMDLTYGGTFGAGHEIMITGGDTILGRPYVTFVHDAVQNDNTRGTGLFDGGFGFAWLDDPGGGARIKFKGYVIGANNLNAEVRNVITESVRDHFECYEVDHAVGAFAGVQVTDLLGPSLIDLRRPKRLCNPASKNDEAPGAPTHPDHLTGYQIKQRAPKFTPVTLGVKNQFGESTLSLVKPDYFFVPTAKSLSGPPSPLDPAAIDHFKCYKAKGAKTTIPNVKVVDQFGTFFMRIKKPMQLCLAANKNDEGIIDPDSALTCYKVVTAPGVLPFRGPAGSVFVDDQFGANIFTVNHHRELCVPSAVETLCGNGVLDPGEDCDPPADQACPGRCEATCHCPVVPPCGPKILVDTDRNNVIDDNDESGKDRWTPARGAFYIVNADDDDGDKKADGAEFGKTVGGIFEPEVINVTNTKIENSNDDLLDITPILISKFNNLTNKTVKLKVANLDQIRGCHIFEKIEKNQEKLWGGPTETATEKDITAKVSTTADVTFGIEGLKFRCVNTAANTPFSDPGTPYAITDANAANPGSFEIAGDHTAEFGKDVLFRIIGSTGNDGEYRVDSSSFGGGKTTIDVIGPVPDGTADGTLSVISDMLFKGFVQLELQCIDNTSGDVESDRVLLKVAPALMLPNSRDSREVYVKKTGKCSDKRSCDVAGDCPMPATTGVCNFSNVSFRDTFKNNLPANHVKEYTTDTQWAQDDVEIGYTQTLRTSMSLALYTRHHCSEQDAVTITATGRTAAGANVCATTKDVGDAKFVRQYLLAKDRGIYRDPGFDDAHLDSFDYGGNLELLPPTAKHELGRINFGKDMSSKKRQFLASQEVQPSFEVDTRWLVVGHVDEFIAYVKEAGGGDDLTVVLASPTKAWAIIDPGGPPLGPVGPGGPPAPAAPPDDPGILFAHSATDGVPFTATGVADGGGFSTLTDSSQNFGGGEPYQYVRIYDGVGVGQIAHVADLFGDTITVDRVWAPFEPTDFSLGDPTDGKECAGLQCVFYSPLSSAAWFTQPSAGSKYILIEDTEFWRSSTTTALGPVPALGPVLPGDTPAAVTFKEAREFAGFKRVNKLAQAKIDAAKALISAAALKADGTPAAVTFKEVPVLYAGKLMGAVGSETLVDRETFAWTPGAANIQFANNPGDATPQKLFVAKQVAFKTDGEKFQPAIDAAIGGLGDILYPDDLEVYHKNTGEVHCGTNVLREFYDFPWWTEQPASVPSLP